MTYAHLHKIPTDATRRRHAVCPECTKRDTIYTWNRDGLEHWFCAACGYEETIEEETTDA